MRRPFLTLMAALMALITTMPSAYATVVLKDVDAQPGVPRTGVLIVGLSTNVHPETMTLLAPFVTMNDAYAKRLAETLAAKSGVHYVELLTGTDVNETGIVNALTRIAKDEKIEFFVYGHKGPGLGADGKDESCFVMTDWDYTQPMKACLPATKVAPLVAKIGKRQLVILDASREVPDLTKATRIGMWGPTADDWPVPSEPDSPVRAATAVLSSGKAQRYVNCDLLFPLLTHVTGTAPADKPLTYGYLTSTVDAIAVTPPDQELPAGIQRCAGVPMRPIEESVWYADVVLIPAIMAPKPETVTTVTTPDPKAVPLPTDPLKAPTKATKKIGTPTVASLIATGVCAAVGGASWAYGEHRLGQYNDEAWADANYPNDNAGRIAAGQAEIPTYGYLAAGGLSCAGVGAAASGLTWYFGNK